MRKIRSAILLALLATLPILPAQESASPIANLTPENQEKLASQMRDAADFIARDRLADAFKALDEAEKVAPNLYSIWNLRGAAWVRLKDVDKARTAFERASQISPKSWDVKFNLAELDFVEKRFPEARAKFAAVLEDNPRLPEIQYDLISFKIFLCLLKEGRADIANKVADRFDYLGDTPAYYYTKAAQHYAKNERGEAGSWISSASRIFNAQENQVYLDSMIELEWVQSIEQPTVPTKGASPAPTPAPGGLGTPVVPGGGPAPVIPPAPVVPAPR